tara:strand:+ start:1297 stop:1500 length:204 start_codon:yes stop_codon:yes gene_type:complete
MESIDKMITRIIEINNELNEGPETNLVNERDNLITTLEIIEKYDDEVFLPVNFQLLGLKFETIQRYS